MIFGEIAVGQAEGAILAHSVKAGGVTLRKGRVLSAADIEALCAGGATRVTVAQLEPGDVAENEAARRLAAALTQSAGGVSVTAPFTGRVNIVAEGPGVARVRAEIIHAVNGIDPMITCATVAPLTRMDPGGLIATIKIISYAVREADLAQAEAACGARPALALHPTVLRTARLIVTQTGAEPSMEKGVEAVRGRLGALGMSLNEVTVCRHATADLAAAIKEAQEDLILILTGSATSDPADVAPEALRQAGGRITRFGMPVDPGNLLFLGHLAQRAVIGLPGCARSPALNGADWVLERIACGLEVSAQDIADMGVGGLLKEIPQRPQPRRGQPKE